jgi:hypothetical protein
MFSKAYQIASAYTFPVIGNNRFSDGRVESGMGSFVVLNNEGWIITSAHIVEGILNFQQHQIEIEKRKNAYLVIDASLISHQSYWWGTDHHRIDEFHIYKDIDIAIGKIVNMDPVFCSKFPILKNPKGMMPGTSLCKMGYPFYDIKAGFNLQKNQFTFDSTVFPIPRFPLDGIFTRTIFNGRSVNNRYDVKFIETSSPGLRGQSGGPIYDKDGFLWAIQSRTMHLPLGFAPIIQINNKEIQENQFLNVGWGTHIESIISILNERNIYFDLENSSAQIV